MCGDTRGGELRADGWSKPELEDLKHAVTKFGELVTPDFTSIPLGGISRVATALAVLKFAERGTIMLDGDVNKYASADVLRHVHARALGAGRGVGHEPGGGIDRYDGDGVERPPVVTLSQLITGCSGLDHKWCEHTPSENTTYEQQSLLTASCAGRAPEGTGRRAALTWVARRGGKALAVRQWR